MVLRLSELSRWGDSRLAECVNWAGDVADDEDVIVEKFSKQRLPCLFPLETCVRSSATPRIVYRMFLKSFVMQMSLLVRADDTNEEISRSIKEWFEYTENISINKYLQIIEKMISSVITQDYN